MTDFLVLLAKINLAMAGAIVLVALLRRPMRAAFHAPVAYALWLLVPAAALASLLPRRAIAVAAPAAGAAHPVGAQIPMAFASVQHMAAATLFDWRVALFAVWLLGVAAMLLYLARAQHQFHMAERLGAAGPAVAGFFKPRIVVPSGFAAQFNAPEQAAILAHEKAHLVRQDARLNAVVAMLRCLNWFNPLVHLGALWFRRDQELACDAVAVSHVSRIDYANALLKSQMRAAASPLGCSWPGGEHPLTERVALLKRPPSSRARNGMGVALVLSLTVCAGFGAWAAEPAQVKPAGNFVGKYFYTERAGDTGPAFMLTLESVDKSGKNVVLHFPYGMAQADHASHDFAADQDMSARKTITLSGNVRMATGMELGIRGNKLVFDARTGLLDLDGKIFPSGMPKYVPCTKSCTQH